MDYFEDLISLNNRLLLSLKLSHISLEKITYICFKHEVAFKITGSG